MKITSQILSSKKESQVLENGGITLSVSKAKTFDECKARFRFCYIEKLPRKEWDFHVFGKFLHEILENFHKELLNDQSLDHNNLMSSCFKEATKNYSLSKEHKDEAYKIIDGYLNIIKTQSKKKILPEVIAVEKDFYIDIGHSVLLNGFIDRVQVDHDGILHVADYKTTKDKKYLTDFFQLLTYAFVLMLEDSSINKIRASYILLRHDFEYVTKEFTRNEVMKVAEKFLNFASEINKEKLWEPSPRFLCKYCDYLDSCKEGKSFLVKRNIIKLAEYGASEW